jgi:hypothetical protein
MRLLIQAVCMLLPFVVMGQNKTYLGIEIGPKFDMYRYEDNGDGLYTKPLFFSPVYGLTIGQELSQTFTVETGFFVNDYGQSFRIRGDDFGYSASNAVLAYQIPLRLKARLKVIGEGLALVPTIGYTLAINTDSGSGGSGSGVTRSAGFGFQNDSTRTQYTSTYSSQKTYGLLETSLALESKLSPSLTLYLAANYMTGFHRVVDMEVKYWINDLPEQSGTVFSNGDYLSIVLGIKYPISHLWNPPSGG